jgi:hypothetical protein
LRRERGRILKNLSVLLKSVPKCEFRKFGIGSRVERTERKE